MNITKQDDGRWKLDFRVGGRESKRIRKYFTTKGEANAYLQWFKNQSADKPWLGEADDNRRLSELCQRWHDLHGQQLNDPGGRMRKLQLICAGLGDPIARKLTVNDFANYRQLRLDGEIPDLQGVKRKVKPKTVNIEHAFLASVFSELKRMGEWKYPNPLDGFAMFKIPESEMGFLYAEEIPIVLQECAASQNPDVLLVAKICLATGCRWSEAETLTGSQVVNNRITFIKTKGKKNRTVPITQELAEQLPRKRGRLFSDCRKAFERAINRTKLELPEGQCSHVLRHTFASHFMMNGGNILVLQRILGHADIKETMKYAHFAPEHLDDALTKNPLRGLELR
ncbi:phage integrase [Shewanella algae]|uniref:phage integrase n=1 Tax=Shewanella algae TaxID=38313 RepID=UPI001AAC8507|nr:tyrosine-type recombinase/integrase [Shewanella algae]MBO2682976.1 tyrosine-type recombinase/integrase [Shewanella algae]